jgi:hypothetical protein
MRPLPSIVFKMAALDGYILAASFQHQWSIIVQKLTTVYQHPMCADQTQAYRSKNAINTHRAFTIMAKDDAFDSQIIVLLEAIDGQPPEVLGQYQG